MLRKDTSPYDRRITTGNRRSHQPGYEPTDRRDHKKGTVEWFDEQLKGAEDLHIAHFADGIRIGLSRREGKT